MSRASKNIWISLGAGMLGVILSIPPMSIDLQERWGLKLLFHLRGVRLPPANVIIIAMDRRSIDALNLPKKTQEWPRTLHAQLVRLLAQRGAKVIVFDVLFDDVHNLVTDNAFAAAVRDSKRVVLAASILQEKIPVNNASGERLVDVNIETVVAPISPLSQAAIAVAPFPLPKVPIQLSQYWAFKASAGNVPTLPVVTYFMCASDLYASFAQGFDPLRPAHLPSIPLNWDKLLLNRRMVDTLVTVREAFNHDPTIANTLLDQLAPEDDVQRTAEARERWHGMIRLFQSNNSRHLNYYGPAGTFLTLSYHEVLQDLDVGPQASSFKVDFKDKVVFVGVSENMRTQYQDGYHTVFSKPNGVDISGVEIAATAFANLLEDRPIMPVKGIVHLLTVFTFGMIQGLICTLLPAGIATLCLLAVGAIYMVTAMVFFNSLSLWIPIFIPLFVLMPLAVFGTVVGRYRVATRERERMRKAFGYYLPGSVIDELASNLSNMDANNQVVYGICLYTDAQQYAALSESMQPDELRHFMNRYYERLFVPVKKNGGIVSDVVGDSMMAIWAKSNPDASLRAAACRAALEISEAIRAFNHQQENVTLHTRIGMHAGHILVGNIGAVDRFEYRPVGDIVNTASRMEGMNKYLGTQILVSDQVLRRVQGFMTRLLGVFQPFGKTNAITIHELLGYEKEASSEQQALCRSFQTGLSAFQHRRWNEAVTAFERTLSVYRADGPSIFYLKQCEAFKSHPPPDDWDGTVVMDRK